MSPFYDLAWLTWLDSHVWQCTCDKTAMSQHPGSHFLIISSVLCKDGNDNYEQLVQWREFGSKCLDAQVGWWIRWWHHFSSDLGSHVCAEQLFQCGKKCVHVEEYVGFSSEQATSILNGDLGCGCCFHWRITTQVCAETISRTWSTTFDHVGSQEGPGDEVILASVCNWTQVILTWDYVTKHVLCCRNDFW